MSSDSEGQRTIRQGPQGKAVAGGHHRAADPSCSLDAAGLACDLVRRPWEYPGIRAPSAGLLVGERFFPLKVVANCRAGQLDVVDVEARWSPAAGAVLPLHEALRREWVAATDERTVVVATGSNAAPAVMQRKCSLGDVSAVVPFLPATVGNLGIGHSAHVSVTGYMAAAPFPADGVSTPVVVSLLDDRQVACLDDTEPNYEPRSVDGQLFPLQLATGEQPATYRLYESRWGVVAPGGSPVALCRQEDLFERLWELPGADDVLGPRGDVRAAMARLAAVAGGPARWAVAEWLRDSGAVMPARFPEAPPVD